MIESQGFERKLPGNSYTDLTSLNSIRTLGRANKNQALVEISKQFESMLVRMMMKSMRDANEVFAKDNMLASPEGNMYQQMYDDQLAVSLGEGRGLGIAESMVKQLQRRFGDEIPDTNVNPLQRSTIKPISTAVAKPLALESAEKSVTAVELTQPVPVAAAMTFDGSVENFVSQLYDIATAAAKKLELDPQVLLAQAALETGWGKKITQHKNGDSSFNLFNIKANAQWQGDSVNVATIEFKDNIAVREQADFRAYQTPAQSFDDYVEFVSNNPRYERALQATDNESYVTELAQSGYATDPEYANKIIRIFNSSSLQAAVSAVKNNALSL